MTHVNTAQYDIRIMNTIMGGWRFGCNFGRTKGREAIVKFCKSKLIFDLDSRFNFTSSLSIQKNSIVKRFRFVESANIESRESFPVKNFLSQ